MPENTSIQLNPEIYESRLLRSVDGHVADLKAVLRSLEDGSFLQHAFKPSSGAVVSFTIGSGSEPERDASQRACANCFKAIISDYLNFVDHMIAFDRVISCGSIKLDEAIATKEQILDCVQTVLDKEYRRVAIDRSLNNPAKIDLVLRTDDALRTAKSLVALRNCLEHRGSTPDADLEFVFRRLVLSTGGVDIKAFPHDVADGKLTFDMRLETKKFPAGTRIELNETDIDNVSLAIRVLAREILELGATAGDAKL